MNASAPRLGKPLVIQDHAEQLVVELLRSLLAPQKSPRAFGMPFEELVPIWNRHRNCVVHGGGCFPGDASFCLRTEQKFVQCRRAHEEVVAKHGRRDHLTDTCFQALRQTALLVLQAECR